MNITKNIKAWLSKKPYTKSQYISAFATIIIAIISFIALIKANNANHIALKALESSRDLFFREMKPYLAMELVKLPDDTGHWYSYKLIPDAKSVMITLQYRVRNIGKSGANNIQFSLKPIPLYEGQEAKISPDSSINLPSLQDIGPGDYQMARINITLQIDNPNGYKLFVDKLKTDSGVNIESVINVTYTNELSSDVKFKSTLIHRTNKKQAIIIKNEYEQLD